MATGSPRNKLSKRTRTILFLVWLAFLVRGVFYCIEQPVWEGFDEWAHFAYVERLAMSLSMPERSDLVPDDVAASIRTLRMPRGQANDATSYTQYEAQQPPLYYLLMAAPYRLTSDWPLERRVLLLRVLSLLLASVTIPLGYRAAQLALEDDRLALFVPIALASLPGLLIDVCRVANDSLAIALSSALTAVMLSLTRPNRGLRTWLAAGLILGALLLTKAFALVFLGLVPLVALFGIRRDRKTALTGSGLCVAVAVAVAGWWYRDAWLATGTISGEQLDAAASSFSLLQKVLAIPQIPWLKVLDAAAFTHIWIGGWSFLVLRSWMYRVFELVAMTAVIGLVVSLWRGCFSSRMTLAAAQFGAFCAAVGYHVVVIFLAGRPPTALGWYFNVVIVAELILLFFGLESLLGKAWVGTSVATVIFLTICMDTYGMSFVLMPYHSRSYQFTWFLYVGANIGLSVLTARLAQNRPNFPHMSRV